jgi:hypothetical protein
VNFYWERNFTASRWKNTSVGMEIYGYKDTPRRHRGENCDFPKDKGDSCFRRNDGLDIKGIAGQAPNDSAK